MPCADHFISSSSRPGEQRKGFGLAAVPASIHPCQKLCQSNSAGGGEKRENPWFHLNLKWRDHENEINWGGISISQGNKPWAFWPITLYVNLKEKPWVLDDYHSINPKFIMSNQPVYLRFKKKNLKKNHQILLLQLEIRPGSLTVNTQSKIGVMIRYSLERKKEGGSKLRLALSNVKMTMETVKNWQNQRGSVLGTEFQWHPESHPKFS